MSERSGAHPKESLQGERTVSSHGVDWFGPARRNASDAKHSPKPTKSDWAAKDKRTASVF